MVWVTWSRLAPYEKRPLISPCSAEVALRECYRSAAAISRGVESKRRVTHMLLMVHAAHGACMLLMVHACCSWSMHVHACVSMVRLYRSYRRGCMLVAIGVSFPAISLLLLSRFFQSE